MTAPSGQITMETALEITPIPTMIMMAHLTTQISCLSVTKKSLEKASREASWTHGLEVIIFYI